MLERLKNVKTVYVYLLAALLYIIGQTFIDTDSILYDFLGILCISTIVFGIYKFLNSK
mgnify:CR=1 FL=1